jgi:ATP-binding cassette, subfamily F, member 1
LQLASGALNDTDRGKKEDRLNAIYEELSAMRADASESQARRILSGLGFTIEMQEAPTKHFSGGWRMRISLARALFMQPDLLLLDEPTNHLDLNAVIWLEDYLQKWKSTLLIVSHDQDFLSAVVTDIIHLEECKLWYYKGNYDDFKEMHAQKIMKQWKDYEKQQKQLKALKDKGVSGKDAKDKALSRAKREAAAGGGKGDKDKGKGKGGAGKGDDGDDGGAASKGDELIVRPREYRVEFTFHDPEALPPPILSVQHASFRYGPKYPWLFKNLDCGIDQGSRIAIVGPNGVGKSTFLSLLIGDLEPSDGEVVRNRFLKVGKYSQHFVDVLPMGKSAVEYLQSTFSSEGLSYQTARALLGRFGLEGHAHTIPISELSGGQKARVVFAGLCMMAPHILIMDEPSNNLDAESIDALGDAIKEFQGGVVLVSHDARLIRNAGCHLWVCDKQNVKPYDGDLDDYKESLLKSIHDEEASMEAVMEKKRIEEEAARLAALKAMKAKREAMKASKATVTA